MIRRILIALGAIILVAAGFVGFQFCRFMRTETIKIDDRFYVVLGGGGNTAVLIADFRPSMLSGTGSTKHALSMPISRPAFISVGLLGMNSPSHIRS